MRVIIYVQMNFTIRFDLNIHINIHMFIHKISYINVKINIHQIIFGGQLVFFELKF